MTNTNQDQRWERLRELLAVGKTRFLTEQERDEFYTDAYLGLPALLEAAAELSALEVANAMNIKMAEEVAENLEQQLAAAQQRIRELERFAEYVLEACGRGAQGDPIVDAARDALKGEFKD